MGADKTNNIMTLSSGVSQSLLADVQYFELYSSLALNRKLKNIVLPGFYCGFEPVPGTGLSVRITSENSEGKGAASVDVNNVQISVQQIEDVTVSVKAGATNIIVLEANFEHGVKTTQVDSASSVSAARIYARTDNTIGQNQIELCRVIVPSGATAVTKEMIVLKYRVNRAVGVEFSNEISSTEERKAATPKAVKAAYDLANGKQPADATLTALAGLATAADRLPYFTGADRAALTTLTAIGRAIIAKGSIKDVLNYLGLGEAAKRDVGTGENQIPDMSAWKRNPSSNRWRKLPDGTIIQMGISASGPLGSPVNITLPISFSNTNYCVVASYDNARPGVSTMVSFAALPVSPSQFSLMSSVTEQGINPFAYWIAFGD
ncbi:TPA: tail fiber protein [Escherichia coli]|nr:tail fiber protein [Escherichia coli]